MDQRPLMMITLPNSGSTWLASLIAQHSSHNNYCMEFFNPIRNPVHYDLLATEFGCELAGCYRNIISAGTEAIDRVIEMTWGVNQYDFTKEVFSPAKLPTFIKYFRCFVFLRDAEDSFPPRRARIWSFYEHAWQAYIDAGIFTATDTHGFQNKALAAHAKMRSTLLIDAAHYNVPVINYRELFEDQGLQEKLQLAIGECDDQLLQAIKDSRVRIAR